MKGYNAIKTYAMFLVVLIYRSMFLDFIHLGPSHYMLHFHFDDGVGVVPKKVISRLEIPSVGETCVVKWSDGKDYEATVKAMGRYCTRKGGVLLFVCCHS